jgi:hypothetical protein
MKITKILVALSFLFAVSTANAGELTVTGNMETTYITNQDGTTGNPFGMDRELKFAGSTELDNGITVSVFQDTSDNLGYGNSQISFGNIAGLATVYIGSDSDPMDAVDDITPSAYEEANGSGSGTYNDIGDLAGEMGIGLKVSVPVLGAVNAKYYPKADGAKNADNANSAATNHAVGSGGSVTIKTNLADLPIAGAFLDGANLTLGYEEVDNSTVANTQDQTGAMAALNYSNGPISVGVQKKMHDEGQAAATAAATTSEEQMYIDTIVGIAYAVNDSLSVSWNRYTSKKHDAIMTAQNADQETDAINIGYTIGGMTVGFQDASTDNAGHVLNTKDDTRTLGVSVAF